MIGTAPDFVDSLTYPRDCYPKWFEFLALAESLSDMPRPYPPEFRARAVALVRAGKPISRVAAELGISEGACITGSVRTGSTVANARD
jgi:hypothetical protein